VVLAWLVSRHLKNATAKVPACEPKTTMSRLRCGIHNKHAVSSVLFNFVVCRKKRALILTAPCQLLLQQEAIRCCFACIWLIDNC
jgi:hypothetical protein